MLIVFKTRWSELTLASAPASAAGHLLIRDCSHSALYPSTIPRNWKSPPSASAAFAVSSGLLIFFLNIWAELSRCGAHGWRHPNKQVLR